MKILRENITAVIPGKTVIPAKAGIRAGSSFPRKRESMDPRLKHSGMTDWSGMTKCAFAGMTTLLIFTSGLFAEATKEVTSDAGLYGGIAGNGPTNIFQWAWCDSAINPNCPSMGWNDQNNVEVNSLSPLDPAPPEGKTSVWAHIKPDTVNPAFGTWGGWGVFNVDAWQSFNQVWRDFSDYSGGCLRFWLKSSFPVDVAIEYEDPVPPGGHNKRTVTIGSTGGVWREVVLPFGIFPAGINFSKIYGMFLVTATASVGEKTFYVDHVRWTKALRASNPLVIFPASIQVNSGKKRQFTIEGRDAAGDPIYLYSKFSAPVSVGTMNPADPNYTIGSILTAGTANGSVTGIAWKEDAVTSLTVTGSVTNTSADLSDILGILSENPAITTLNLTDGDPAQNGAMAIYPSPTEPSPPNAPPVVSNDFTDYVEGSFSVKTVFPTMGSLGYGGWAVQWGNLASTDLITKDMSGFYEGYIRFWFKGPSSLQSLLSVGIRSGNVPAKKEISKALLSSYGVAFDNQWHSVQIPIADFAKSRPWADLSRTKVFFNIAIEGALAGTIADRTFFIDNVRWDTKVIGPLATVQINPGAATIPLGGARVFTARGLDASGNPVDIYPTWDMPSGSLGTLSSASGVSTILRASNSPVSGTIRATVGSLSATGVVNVQAVNFPYQKDIYSDTGVRGDIGISTAPATHTNTYLTADASATSGGAPEGTKYFHSIYTLNDSAPGAQDSFALWFIEEPNAAGAYMRYYEDGYLSFYVKTNHDLEVSIRSNNVTANNNRAKIRLSEMGIPLNNTWQKVLISMADFAARETMDFSHVKTYFAIGAVSKQIGEVANQTFDVDYVQWLSNSGEVPDKAKVYQGIKNKQRPSGLLRSFNDTHAHTYDQAVAAMTFTYNRVPDAALAKKIFDAYKTIRPNGDGYANDYQVDTFGIWDADRVCGPNAILLLALIQYRVATGDNAYDTMIDGLATWLKSFQDTDGGVGFGVSASVPVTTKSTEHNFDCYAAFRAYAILRNNSTYNTAADNVLNWLKTKAWYSAQQRFYVGVENGTPNADKALDTYSWAPLALGTDFSQSLATLLPLAETDFGNTQSFWNGNSITGVDFGSFYGAPPDKDAVWIEGTAQMAQAYGFLGNTAARDRILNELKKAVYTLDATSQGLTYATNNGTAYGGWLMNSTDPSLSSMAWYLFVENKFNPFNVHPLHTVKIKNISDNAVVSQLSWTVTVPQDKWVRANQYLEIIDQPITNDGWGVQIYTDNTNASAVPKFVDPTPTKPNNKDSNPAGLLWVSGGPTSSITLPIAWSIKDNFADAPPAHDPDDKGSNDSFQWLYFKDSATPAIDLNENGQIGDLQDGTPFVLGESWVTTMNGNGIHGVQGPVGSDYFPSSGPDYVFIEGNFSTGAAQVTYKGIIVVENYWQ